MEIKISDILRKYDTDKANGHHYGELYDEIFSVFDRNAPLNILEVGTQKGGSLLAWKESFPNATVTGVDIIDVVTEGNRSDTVTYVVSDIKDYKTDELFDIIIDDGSHLLSDVLHVVREFSGNLKKDGIMIIEDTQDPVFWMHDIKQILSNEFKVGFRDVRHINDQYDDFLIVITRI